MDDVRSSRKSEAIPVPLWIIALIALSPFPVTAGLYAYGPDHLAKPALTMLLEWAAVSLAFLGGVKWGLETREPNPRWVRQAFAATCAVAGWVILLSRGRAPDEWLLGGFLAAFMLQWLFDHQTPDTPSRYPLLSTTVTAAACISLAVALEKLLSA